MSITRIKNYANLACITICIAVIFIVLFGIFTAIGKYQDEKFMASETRQMFRSYITIYGGEEAYRLIKKTVERKSYPLAHNHLHLFGDVLYEVEGEGGFGVCDNTASFACFHGFFARAVTAEGLFAAEKLSEECKRIFQKNSISCEHGIGHGIMEFLGQSRIADALEVCERMQKEPFLLGCMGGVFMEYNFPADISVSEVRQFYGDPYYPCDDLPKKYAPACFYEITQWWEKIFGTDYKKMGELCGKVKGDGEKEICFLGVGSMTAISTNYQKEEAKELCRKMHDQNYEMLCRAGALWGFYANPSIGKSAAYFCYPYEDLKRKICFEKADILSSYGTKLLSF